MGSIDEHWCSDCKKTLDKLKDQYLDLENIRLKEFPGKKGLICKECLDKPEYEGLRKLLGAGNPDFRPFIDCALHAVCATFKAVKARPVRCGHIAAIGDTVYCKRRHPGAVKLPVERSERVRYEQKLLLRYFRRMTKSMSPDMATTFTNALDEGLKNVWVPPSSVITARPGGGESPANEMEKTLNPLKHMHIGEQ